MQEKEIRRELQKGCSAQDRELADVSELISLALQARKRTKPSDDQKKTA